MPRVESSSSEDEEPVIDRGSKSKKRKLDDQGTSSSKKQTDQVLNEEGNVMHDLGSKRFASVSTFKGKLYVNIREYYEKDGKMLPGKKGISLSQEQYNNLKKHLKDLDEDLEK